MQLGHLDDCHRCIVPHRMGGQHYTQRLRGSSKLKGPNFEVGPMQGEGVPYSLPFRSNGFPDLALRRLRGCHAVTYYAHDVTLLMHRFPIIIGFRVFKFYGIVAE